MRTLLKVAGATLATSLLAGALASPAVAEPRPETPAKKTYTTRTVACEWRDPGTGKDKFSKFTARFLLIDGQAFMVTGFSVRGKTSRNPIFYAVGNHDNLSGGPSGGIPVASGTLDERGRASEKTRHVLQGDTLSIILASSEFDLLDPTSWFSAAPDLCAASIEVPYYN